ncbi:NAD(P)H-binding protein [Chitinivorax sp. B]|uniref:NAD(P)-dependent oxidoreductase n=1 Tax=Chitinivorax sp. B TaxID=2502235 RepID=UPI0010F66D3B|nr:NAD(P)H-binding protein [Chitinivorax sp. B]
MKIALIGATGFVGQAILNEALARGHHVTAIVRDPSKLPQHANLTANKLDVFDTAALTAVLAGHDSVINAYNGGWNNPNIYQDGVKAHTSIINASVQASTRYFLQVGGAGSMEIAPGLDLIDTPEFPEQWKQGALATREAYRLLKQKVGMAWTFLAPAPDLHPGERTGRYEVIVDRSPLQVTQSPNLTSPDYAVAVLDEIESPKHDKQRFSAFYAG